MIPTVEAPIRPLKSLEALLAGAVDYAGLFPPSTLGMRSAVESYATYLRDPEAWMLGRFVVPVTRLDEFEQEFGEVPLLNREAGTPWHLSVVAQASESGGMAPALERMGRLNCKQYGRAVIDTVEIRASSAEQIAGVVNALPNVYTVYFESPAELVSAIAAAGARAKIRTGGTTEDAFPSARDIAQFIKVCHENSVPFKATAGLHHPLRGNYRLTYEDDSKKGMMFGYLNIFLAAAFTRSGMGEDEVIQLLEESNSDAITLSNDEIAWRSHRLSATQLAEAHDGFIQSFGSCSFREPVDEIKEIIK